MDWIAIEKEEFERRFALALPAGETAPARLHRAMRYSALGPGKRLRPLLCRAAAHAVAGGDCEAAWAPAMAVECIHAYSLIHDDLPALDNDDLRRGRATCHKVFGEAMAILAGDALQTLAFELLADAGAASVHALARAAGTPGGMVAGQVADLEAADLEPARTQPTLAQVEFIHRAKTAALIRAAVVLGGLAAGADAGRAAALERFGAWIGFAFQVADDVLDAPSDAAQRKPSYAVALGVEAATAEAQRLREAALAEVADWGRSAGRLRLLAERLVNRVH